MLYTFCDDCLEDIARIGSKHGVLPSRLESIYRYICVEFMDNGAPVWIALTPPHMAILAYLEWSGYIVTSEVDGENIKAKPSWYVVDSLNDQVFFCNPHRTKKPSVPSEGPKPKESSNRDSI